MSRKLSFDFKRRRRREQDRPLGLVVGPKAVIIMKKGEKVDGVWQPDTVLFDGVKAMEEAYRTSGRPAVVFDDSDEDGGSEPT